MPKVHNWEDWDEAEEWVKREQSRIKTNGKVNEKNKKENQRRIKGLLGGVCTAECPITAKARKASKQE